MMEGAALSGLRVLELAHLIAGPMAGSFLADLGADVVHVEDPVVGDPQRVTGTIKNGISVWWKVSGRNKRCITLDLRRPEGQELARRLVAWSDVVITNFRLPTLEKWSLDWPSLHAENPKLIMLQISGFGANTSLRDQPGFGKVAEAMSGVVALTGFPDGPPVHTGFSHGDSVTGMFGAFAILAALYRRAQDENFQGEWIDLALFEGLYRLCEWQVALYDQTGVVPERSGNQLANAPAAVINTYRSRDDRWITITSGTPRSVQKIAAFLGEPAEDYDTPEKQNVRRGRLDALVRAYVEQNDADSIVALTRANGVVASKIFDVAEIVNDQTYAERGDVISVDDEELGPIRMQAALPHMKNHGGRIWRAGPRLAEDNELVYCEYLGLKPEEFDALRMAGVV